MATSPSLVLVRNNSSDVPPTSTDNVDTQRLKRRAISEDSNLRVKKIVTDQQFKSSQLDFDRMTAVASRSNVISPAGTVETPLELIDLTSSSDDGEILSPPVDDKSAVVVGRQSNSASNSGKIDGDLLNPSLMSHEEIVRSSVSPDDSFEWQHVQTGLQASSSRPDLHQPIQMVQVGHSGSLEGPSRIYDPIASPSNLMGHSHSNCHGHLHVTVTPTPIICACANNLGRCGCTAGVAFCSQMQLCPYCTSGQSISPNHRCIHGYSVETPMPPASLYPPQFWNAAGPSITSAAEMICPQTTANYAESLAGLYNLSQTNAGGRAAGSPSVSRSDSRGGRPGDLQDTASIALSQLLRMEVAGRNVSRSPQTHLPPGVDLTCSRQENQSAGDSSMNPSVGPTGTPTSWMSSTPTIASVSVGNPPFHRRPASSIPLGQQRLLQQQHESVSRQRDAQTRWYERQQHLQAVQAAQQQQPSLFHHVFNPTVNPTAFNPVPNSLANPIFTSLARAAAAATIPSLATQVNLSMGGVLGLDLHGNGGPLASAYDPTLLVNPNDNGGVPVTTPQYPFSSLSYLPTPVHQRGLVDPLSSAYGHPAANPLHSLHPSLNPLVNSRHCQYPSLIPLQMPHVQQQGRPAGSYQPAPPATPYQQHVGNSAQPSLHRHHHHYTGSPVFAPQRQPELTHTTSMAPVPTLGDFFRFSNVQLVPGHPETRGLYFPTVPQPSTAYRPENYQAPSVGPYIIMDRGFGISAHLLQHMVAEVMDLPQGAAQQTIDQCTITRLFQKPKDGDDERCAVCLSEFEQDEQIRSLPCMHIYHVPCIDRWLSTNKRCPICRVDIDRPPVSQQQQQQQR